LSDNYLLVITIMAFLLFLMVISYLKLLISPLSIFVSIWFIVILTYSLNLFDRPQVENSTLLFILISVLFFTLGYILNNFKKKDYKLDSQVNESIEVKNGEVLVILTCLAILSIAPTFFSQFKNFISGNSLDDNKHLLMNEQINLGFLYVYFGKPLRIILSMIAAIMLISKKKNIVFISLVIVLMMMDYVCTGSKNIFFSWGTQVILLVILKYKNLIKELFRKNIKTFLIGIVSIFLIFYSMYQKNNFGKNMYYYISGNVPFLDYSLKIAPIQYDQSTLGFVTFNGLIRIPFVILNSIGVDFYPNILIQADKYLLLMDNFIYLNSYTIFNAFTTIFFYFYLDFGKIGLIIVMVAFGYISSGIYLNMMNKKTAYAYLCFIFLMSFIFNSIGKSILFSPSYGIALLYIVLIFRPILSKKIVI